MKKWAIYFASFITLFIASLIFGLSTHLGSQFLVERLNQNIAGLHIELTEGEIVGQAHWGSISWHDETYKIHLRDTGTSLTVTCLFNLRICIDKPTVRLLDIESLVGEDQRVVLNKAKISNSKASSFLHRLNAVISELSIQHLTLISPDLIVSVDEIKSDITFSHERIAFQSLFIDSMTISQKNSNTKIAQALTPTSTIQQRVDYVIDRLERQSQRLAHWIPAGYVIDLDVVVTGGQLKHAWFISNGERENLVDTTLSLVINKHGVQISEFRTNYKHVGLSLEGHAHFNNPLDVSAQFNITSPHITLNGRVESVKNQYELFIETSGDVVSQHNASFNFDNFYLEINSESVIEEMKLEFESQDPVLISKLAFSTKGNLNALNLSLTTDISNSNHNTINVDLFGMFNRRQLVLDHFSLKSVLGTEENRQVQTQIINGSATAKWDNTVVIAGSVELNQFNFESFFTELPITLTGESDFSGELTLVDETQWKASIIPTELSLIYNEVKLGVEGHLQLNDKMELDLSHLKLSNDVVNLTAKGRVGSQVELVVKLAMRDSIKMNEMYFKGGGILIVKGGVNQPEFDGEVIFERLQFNDINAKRVKFAAQGNKLKGTMTLNVDQLHVANEKINNISIVDNFNGNEHEIKTYAEYLMFKQNSDFLVSYTEQVTDVSILKSRIDSENKSWELAETTTLIRSEELINTVNPLCWINKRERVCLDYSGSLTSGAFDILTHNLALDSAAFVKTDISIVSNIDSKSKIEFIGGKITLLENTTQLNYVELIDFDEKNILISDLALTASFALRENIFSGEMNFSDLRYGGISASLTEYDLDSQLIRGEISVSQFNVNLLSVILPDIDFVSGLISGETKLSGKVNKPELNGHLQFTNGHFRSHEQHIEISKALADITFTGEQAKLTSAMQVNTGQASISGTFSWSEQWRYQLNMLGKGIVYDDRNGVKVKLEPDLVLSNKTGRDSLIGNISMPMGLFKTKSMSSEAITISKDAVIINQVQKNKPRYFLEEINAQVTLGDNVVVDSYGLESDVKGSLKLELDRYKNILVIGELNFENGRYRSFGQDLILRKGQLSFVGPADNPYINIEAIRNEDITADDVIVGIQAVGTANNPQVTLFSEPAFTEPEMTSYLLRGRNIDSDDDPDQNNMLMAILVNSSLGQSENLFNTLGNKIGVTGLAVETTGQGDDTNVQIRGYVYPRVQVRYGVGLFTAIEEAAVRYEFLPKLYVELSTGLNNAVDFYYKFTR